MNKDDLIKKIEELQNFYISSATRLDNITKQLNTLQQEQDDNIEAIIALKNQQLAGETNLYNTIIEQLVDICNSIETQITKQKEKLEVVYAAAEITKPELKGNGEKLGEELNKITTAISGYMSELSNLGKELAEQNSETIEMTLNAIYQKSGLIIENCQQVNAYNKQIVEVSEKAASLSEVKPTKEETQVDQNAATVQLPPVEPGKEEKKEEKNMFERFLGFFGIKKQKDAEPKAEKQKEENKDIKILRQNIMTHLLGEGEIKQHTIDDDKIIENEIRNIYNMLQNYRVNDLATVFNCDREKIEKLYAKLKDEGKLRSSEKEFSNAILSKVRTANQSGNSGNTDGLLENADEQAKQSGETNDQQNKGKEPNSPAIEPQTVGEANKTDNLNSTDERNIRKANEQIERDIKKIEASAIDAKAEQIKNRDNMLIDLNSKKAEAQNEADAYKNKIEELKADIEANKGNQEKIYLIENYEKMVSANEGKLEEANKKIQEIDNQIKSVKAIYEKELKKIDDETEKRKSELETQITPLQQPEKETSEQAKNLKRFLDEEKDKKIQETMEKYEEKIAEAEAAGNDNLKAVIERDRKKEIDKLEREYSERFAVGSHAKTQPETRERVIKEETTTEQASSLSMEQINDIQNQLAALSQEERAKVIAQLLSGQVQTNDGNTNTQENNRTR